MLAASLRGLDRDNYFQVAMLTTIGLTSKNAILIIAFAKDNVEQGVELVEATLLSASVGRWPNLDKFLRELSWRPH